MSYDAYLHSKTLELGQSIAAVPKIYLDTKFWINLRNVELGRTNDVHLKSLLDLLKRLVVSGRAICPLSAEIFREIFRQSDDLTLTACAKLIDELSLGICLVDQTSRVGIEAFHFIRQATTEPQNVHPLKHLAWTKSAYVLGHVMPTFNSPDLQRTGHDVALQKAFLDQLWQTTLSDLLEVCDCKFRLPDSSDISSSLNDGKIANLHDNTSFHDLFLIELRGVLDVCRPTFADVMRQIYERDTGNVPTTAEIANDKSGDWIANLIYEYFRRGKASGQLPTIRMEAGLHAGVRWDKARKFKPNDCADFRHAAAAIPYFDFFLTERSLSHLLSDGNLKLRDDFSCVVLADASNALRALTHLEN